VCVKIT